MASSCNLCAKEVSKKIHATACLVCEQDHTVTVSAAPQDMYLLICNKTLPASQVHQRCFDKAIEKAIRVRSTRSTAFEVRAAAQLLKCVHGGEGTLACSSRPSSRMPPPVSEHRAVNAAQLEDAEVCVPGLREVAVGVHAARARRPFGGAGPCPGLGQSANQSQAAGRRGGRRRRKQARFKGLARERYLT